MAFRKLTKKGEEFILNRCTRSGNRFAGMRSFALPKSNLPAGTMFTAKPKDDSNVSIISSEHYAKCLIKWFNAYSEQYKLDANIIAAQSYAESGYDLWTYSEGGAMGLVQFLDVAIWDIIFKNKYTFDNELVDIKKGLINSDDIRYIIPNYSTRDKSIISTPTTTAGAKENRKQLFQNIIDNPEVMIKAQCFMMSKIGQKNNNLAASSLFAYNRGAGLSSSSYEEIIQTTAQRYGKEYIQEGIKYVDRIFNLLGGKEPGIPAGIHFGYEIDKNIASMSYQNYVELKNANFPISIAQEAYVGELHPLVQNLFREFIYKVEKETPFKVIITSGYRTFAEQDRIKKKNESYNPKRPASSPGNSYHNYGFALDIALESKTVSNVIYSFNRTVAEWKQTGVPKIAKDLGLRWGGDFDTADQVHFDVDKYGAPSDLKSIAYKQFGTDPKAIEGNQIRVA